MKVAVVGSGVSGLAATWYLSEFSDHEVHVFENDDRPGGHANTVPFARPGQESIDVDTGFIVFNPTTYPNFLRFLNRYPSLRARIQQTTMTFSVSRDGGAFEWAGNSPASLFCQPWRLLDPRMWQLVYDILKFNACAGQLLIQNEGKNPRVVSIGEYLIQEGYSESFRDNYLIPMTAAIWSTPPDTCALDFAARTLIQFMHNHHLLQIIGKPSWLTLAGGSKTYVQHILSLLPSSQLHLSAAVSAVRTVDSRVEIDTPSGVETFDHVILACHADDALQMLKEGGTVTLEETRVLKNFEFSNNEAILHWDERLLPKRRIAWSCWNYLTESQVGLDGHRKPNVDRASLTYWMNDLQHIPIEKYGPVLVTLNAPFEPAPEKVIGRWQYSHPLLSTEAVRAQTEMPLIQNKRGISFAGAWMKYGFHEDGFTAGLRAAANITASIVKLSNGNAQVDGHEARGTGVPFEILPADRAPGQSPWLVMVFSVFERSGMRLVAGSVLCWLLLVLRRGLLWTGVDMHGLEAELRASAR